VNEALGEEGCLFDSDQPRTRASAVKHGGGGGQEGDCSQQADTVASWQVLLNV
jgi:hypothetical protein